MQVRHGLRHIVRPPSLWRSHSGSFWSHSGRGVEGGGGELRLPDPPHPVLSCTHAAAPAVQERKLLGQLVIALPVGL